MGLLGYADRISVAPGDSVRFKVSAEVPAYEATIVRFTHPKGDQGDLHYGEERVESPVGGWHRGRKQDLYAGSYVLVADSPALRAHRSRVAGV